MTYEPDALARLLDQNDQVTRVEAFLTDVNGIPRGKWLPRAKALTLTKKGLPMPRSVFALDIWGRDVADAGLAFGTGDPDGLCFPVADRVALVPWLDEPSAQVMLSMRDANGGHFVADPRGVLARIVDALRERGLTAVVATEPEFYLHRIDGHGRPIPPAADQRRDAQLLSATLSTDALVEHQALFDAINAACAAQNIPAEALLSEAGPGQFELNLIHRSDALAAADDAILLKRTIKAVAARHGLGATFMAKPYGDASGNGMHVHVSLLDADGANIFAKDDGQPSDALFHAVAGLVNAMPASMLAFAPHANSYRRFRANAHAPVSAGWGMDDRSAAVRVVVGDAKSTRIEHRVAGADCNPYLAVAAILAGIISGLDAGEMPPPEQDRAHPDAGTALPTEWGAAIEAFASSPFIARHFGTGFRDIFLACKRQDRDTMLGQVSDMEYASYLGAL